MNGRERMAHTGATTATDLWMRHVRRIALLGLIGYLGCAAAQNSSPKQTAAQKRVQTKLFQQKKMECAKLGKYAAATTIRGATLYKCVVRPGG